MARPKIKDAVRLNLSIDRQTKERLMDRSRRSGLSVSEQIERWERAASGLDPDRRDISDALLDAAIVAAKKAAKPRRAARPKRGT